MNKTGIPALDSIIAATNKAFGKDFSSQDFGDVTRLQTGSARLDAMIAGGLPKAGIIEIFGWESSGKTSLALSIIARRQKERKKLGITGKRDLFIDLEHSMTRSFIEGFGIDMDEVIWVRPDLAEEALQIAIDYPKSGAIDMMLFDSVDAAQNSKMVSRQVGENDVGGISKDMNFALRQLSKIAVQTETTCIFINQIKQSPNVMGGNPNTTTGGNALKFYALVRFELLRGKPSEVLPGAMMMRIKIAKTKVSMPYHGKPIELDFIYGKGFDPALDLMNYAKSLGILRFAGSATKVTWEPGGEEETESLCTGGKAGFMEWLQDEENFEKIRIACLKFDPFTANPEETEDATD